MKMELHAIKFDDDPDTHGIWGRITPKGSFKPRAPAVTLCRLSLDDHRQQMVWVGPGSDIDCIQCLLKKAGPAPVEVAVEKEPELVGV